MASSKDFKIIHDRYQSEGAPHGLSIVQFCRLNGIVYSHYEKWYKRTHGSSDSSDVVEVEVVNCPDPSPSHHPATPLTLSFEIKLSNGLEVRNISSDLLSLRRLVERLEVLC